MNLRQFTGCANIISFPPNTSHPYPPKNVTPAKAGAGAKINEGLFIPPSPFDGRAPNVPSPLMGEG